MRTLNRRSAITGLAAMAITTAPTIASAAPADADLFARCAAWHEANVHLQDLYAKAFAFDEGTAEFEAAEEAANDSWLELLADAESISEIRAKTLHGLGAKAKVFGDCGAFSAFSGREFEAMGASLLADIEAMAGGVTA